MAAKKVIMEFEARVKGLEDDLKKIQTQLDKVAKKGKKTSDSIGSIQAQGKKALGMLKNVAGTVGVAFGVREVIRFGQEMVNIAGKAKGVEEAFRRIGSAGLLDELRQATRGTVSDLQLMQEAVKASNFDIPLTQLASLFDFARRRAKETGEEVDYLVQSIILGIGRKSPLILDNLGISAVKLRQELKGVSAESASVGDVAEVVGRIASEAMATMGEETITAADRQQQLRAEFLNTQRAVGEKLIPIFNEFINAGNNLLTTINNMVEGNERFGKGSLNVFEETNKNITVARSLADTYDTLAKKTNLNDIEKEQLRQTTFRLSQEFGTSVVSINKETGALEVNRKELENQLMIRAALQSDAAQQLLAERQSILANIENMKSARAVLEAMRNDTQDVRVIGLINQFLAGEGGSADLDQTITRLRSELTGIAAQDLERIITMGDQVGGMFADAFNEERVKEIDASLKAMGLSLEDLTELIIEQGNANEDADKKTKSYNLNTIKGIQERIKLLQEEANKTDYTTSKYVDLITEIDRLKKKLEEALNVKPRVDEQALQEFMDMTVAMADAAIPEGAELQFGPTKEQIAKAREMYIQLGMTDEEYAQHRFSIIKQQADALLAAGALEIEQYEKIMAMQQKLLENSQATAFDVSMALVGGLSAISGAMVDLFSKVNDAQSQSGNFAKTMALFNLSVQSAEAIGAAISAAFKNPTNLTLPQQIAQVAASTALVLSNINRARQILANEPPQPPQFEQGGMVGGQLHSSGGTMIEAERGEYVINRRMTAKYKDAVTAINKGYFEQYVLKHYVAPLQAALAQPQQSFADNIAESIMEQQSRYLKKISRGVMVTNIRDIAKHMQGPNINRFKA